MRPSAVTSRFHARDQFACFYEPAAIFFPNARAASAASCAPWKVAAGSPPSAAAIDSAVIAAKSVRSRLRNCSVNRRGASNCRRAATAQKTRLYDSPLLQSRGQLEHVSADRVANLHNRIRVRQFSGVSRIPKMIENRFAEHYFIFGGRYFFSIEAITT